MGIDFHHKANRNSYTAREADQTWVNFVRELIPSKQIDKAADIGCGGGIYSKGLVRLGAAEVTGVDYSEAILSGAKDHCKEFPQIRFVQGEAEDTGLHSHQYDLVLERALIHHIKDLDFPFNEAYRLLKTDGTFLIQDRTPEDCLLEGTPTHIRFFRPFPTLAEKEINRRHKSETVRKYLKQAGFKRITEAKLWEVRKTYPYKQQLLDDLQSRTGRSILHELDDRELKQLVDHIATKLPEQNVIEKDRWTIWWTVK